MDPSEAGIVVTGANGQLGRAILTRLSRSGRGPGAPVRALVRSERARQTIESMGLDPAPEIRIVDYLDPRAMEEALRDRHCVIHLVGIIKETRTTRYVEAHERTCQALTVAANRTRIERIVYLSILGSSPDSDNACLASKGR
ncbi:MAG TPA: NAD-dependent epimerase/dehydratase family protein, partial [Deltaproteobacteria bacterium]|nr:NAD-dependent epimerase/dehydratase family protein [Deltaproteobacteria bacterium]